MLNSHLMIYVTMGCQASGKSTWAKMMVAQSSNIVRFNRDEIRCMMNGGNPWQHFGTDKQDAVENTVTAMRDAFLEQALREHKNIILDETNVQSRTFREVCKFLDKRNYDVTVLEQPFYCDLATAIDRDAKRADVVGEKIITQFFNRLGGEKFQNYTPKTRTFSKLPPFLVQEIPAENAIICDLDGTLALFGNKNPYDRDFENDDLNKPVAYILKEHQYGNKIIFVSGRFERYREQTTKFLNKHGFFHFELFMREDGDVRNDKIVKREIFMNDIHGKYNIRFVLDDRNRVVDMWRNMGLTCFQVAPGDF